MTTVKVITFHKGEIDLNLEENDKAPFLSKVIYGECPVCGKLAEEDLMYHGPGMSGMQWACDHVAHYKVGEEPRYE